jgi:hypothetical protein
MSANKANIIAVLGASGSGKSTFIKRALAKRPGRLLIWDPMREYGAFGETFTDLAGLVKAMDKPRFKLVFLPNAQPKVRDQQFDLFCRAALAAGNLVLVVEELRFVTTPSRAPLGWAQVTLTGRHAGLTVYGASQRPASIDKDFLGNATLVRCGCLTYPEDIRAVAKAMRLPEADLEMLKPLEWVEFDRDTRLHRRGKLTF